MLSFQNSPNGQQQQAQQQAQQQQQAQAQQQAQDAVHTMRLREDPPPITPPATRSTRKRKSPPTDQPQQPPPQPQQPMQHVLPPPHALMHPMQAQLPPGYPHVKALESRSQLLDAALASADEANRRWEECRALVDQLRVENAALRAALSQAQLLPPGAAHPNAAVNNNAAPDPSTQKE
ncbi:hypothetical protein BD779DRAFT_1505400 [Infundibulicybe gibba]|nr:hypothetical protein BD779DRAFT_1505400 [Infundibulicybe gibba]